MKNQYFGDENDYRKYGLLRCLLSSGELSCLVAWMLTADDGSADGRFRDYLAANHAQRWRPHDPPLYDHLSRHLTVGRRLCVSAVEQSALLPRARFFGDEVPDAGNARVRWREQLFAAARDVDLVFLDPDNGIEVASKPVGSKGSQKFVMKGEIEHLFDQGASLLIYQHFPRRTRQVFIDEQVQVLASLTRPALLEAVRTPRVVFFLISQERHRRHFTAAIADRLPAWKGQIDVVGLSPAFTSVNLPLLS